MANTHVPASKRAAADSLNDQNDSSPVETDQAIQLIESFANATPHLTKEMVFPPEKINASGSTKCVKMSWFVTNMQPDDRVYYKHDQYSAKSPAVFEIDYRFTKTGDLRKADIGKPARFAESQVDVRTVPINAWPAKMYRVIHSGYANNGTSPRGHGVIVVDTSNFHLHLCNHLVWACKRLSPFMSMTPSAEKIWSIVKTSMEKNYNNFQILEFDLSGLAGTMPLFKVQDLMEDFKSGRRSYYGEEFLMMNAIPEERVKRFSLRGFAAKTNCPIPRKSLLAYSSDAEKDDTDEDDETGKDADTIKDDETDQEDDESEVEEDEEDEEGIIDASSIPATIPKAKLPGKGFHWIRSQLPFLPSMICDGSDLAISMSANDIRSLLSHLKSSKVSEYATTNGHGSISAKRQHDPNTPTGQRALKRTRTSASIQTADAGTMTPKEWLLIPDC